MLEGAYPGFIVRNDDVLIEGEPDAATITANEGNAFEIVGDRVIVRNLAARTTAADGTSHYPIRVRGTDCTIERCNVVSSALHGIVVHRKGAGSQFLMNRVSHTFGAGILSRAKEVRVFGNVISKTTREGIVIAGHDNEVIGNLVSLNAKHAISLSVHSQRSRVMGNLVRQTVMNSRIG